jgi:hypothetical protein
MYAQQSFSKTEVEKLCNNYLDSLSNAEKQLFAHFKQIEDTQTWWQKLFDLSDDRAFAFSKLERYRREAAQLKYFATANTGTLTLSSVLLDTDTYTKIIRCSHVILTDIIETV